MTAHMSKHTASTTPTGIGLGVDIGGTHISAALTQDGHILPQTYQRTSIDPAASASIVLDTLAGLIRTVQAAADQPLDNIGIAMPGPFDYPNGISMIQGLNKYEHLYGLNIREALYERLADAAGKQTPIRFANDAACFGLGAAVSDEGRQHKKIIAITLGTGFGACFIDNQHLVTGGIGVPPNGYLYDIPFKDGIAEDYISTRWLLNAYPANDVRQLAQLAKSDVKAAAVLEQFGVHLGALLTPWILRFEADAVIIGGSIARAYALFSASMRLPAPVVIPENTEWTAITGAASLNDPIRESEPPARKTRQSSLPVSSPGPNTSGYDIYPFEPLGNGRIFSGYSSLARWIAGYKGVRIEGYAGIDWRLIRHRLCEELRKLGIAILWYETSAFLKTPSDIETMVRPFLGQEGAVWGTKTTLNLADWFIPGLSDWRPEQGSHITIFAGPGSALSQWDTPVIYFDLPKNELQYRMRAGSAVNLGGVNTGPFAEMYKRSYFVDWVVLNKHRREICNHIAIVADGQHEEEPNWTLFDSIRKGMRTMAENFIRPRPWFEPGVWGGQWMKQHIPMLSKDEVNYAWSFELIAPENGIVFESDGLLLEIAFDWLMQCESEAILGVDAGRFKEEFPIRFDFLDTFGGGNLSIQCHPSLPYIQQHFGENITQDETYYILDCKPGAGVYLGFTEDIDPTSFRQILMDSQTYNQAIDIEAYVQLLPAQKHDLFLIPNQTIHGAGINNLVLEISATPYIFTFKMYDWMRLDLEGMPRPINIEHAFHNLDFERKGPKVKQELVSQPQLLRSEPGMQLELLPTHPEHFYAIHRITLMGNTTIATEEKCHLLMLVEGKEVTVVTAQGKRYQLRYAETFLLPAAAGSYRLENTQSTPLKLIKAYVK